MIRIAICDNDTAASDKLAASIKTLAASHKANCQIRCFSKGAPLLYEIEDNIQFDLFFLETQLPDMDGFLLAKKIKEHQSDCLFLFAFQILGLNVRNTSAGNPYAGCDPAAAVYTFTIPLDACTYTNAFLADVKTDAGGNFHAFSET